MYLSEPAFSGSFLILISLTSPVLSSVAALTTIFLVAIVDRAIFGTVLTPAAIFGGLLIIGAFALHDLCNNQGLIFYRSYWSWQAAF